MSLRESKRSEAAKDFAIFLCVGKRIFVNIVMPFLEVIMLNSFKNITLFFVFFLLIICPATSFAWRSYGYWDYHGSGRDYPYSYYIDNYYSQGHAFSYSIYQPDFIDDDFYFSHVTTPAIIPLPVQYSQIPVALSGQQNEFTVNVPNDHGGYTAVVIKRSGNGFTGPQGEFYPEFPKVSQLKIMYGK